MDYNWPAIFCNNLFQIYHSSNSICDQQWLSKRNLFEILECPDVTNFSSRLSLWMEFLNSRNALLRPIFFHDSHPKNIQKIYIYFPIWSIYICLTSVHNKLLGVTFFHIRQGSKFCEISRNFYSHKNQNNFFNKNFVKLQNKKRNFM